MQCSGSVQAERLGSKAFGLQLRFPKFTESTRLLEVPEMTRRGIAALIFSLVTALSGSAQPDNGRPVATILCYHVVESPSDTHFAISRAEFLEQVDYLQNTGYNVIPMADLVRFYKGEIEELPENAVVITVDDGWRCTYDIIYKELSARGIPFTAFLYPKYVIGGTYSLTWDQVREMAANGVEIQSHTLSHGYLTRDRSGQGGNYESWLTRELVESKRILEEKVGKTVDVLAYPYGAYDDVVARATKRAGYAAALTCNFGSVTPGTDPFKLNRVVIDRTTTFNQFRKYLGVGRLEVTDISPSPDRSWNPAYPVVAARLVDPEAVEPESVQMSLLDGTQVPSFYDPRDGSISLVLREGLPTKKQSVLVWATDAATGKRLEATWTIEPRKPARRAIAVARTPAPPAGALSGGSLE